MASIASKYLRPLAWLALACSLLAACSQTVSPDPLPELTFSHLGKIRLNVASVEIVENYVPPLRGPNIEHSLPMSPTDAARRWSVDRLVAMGTEGSAKFVIETASIVETKLPVEKGLRGAVTVDQAERYDAILVVTLEIRNDRGFRLAFATARAERSETIPENLTLREREAIQFELVESLVSDLNGELEAKIAEFLSAYIL
ncbi:MAG: hypothetical protein HQ495_10680 [Alphaproteobacteria bacterium]|nr:hypothetical protein [Alphaproteobacteria bacterium]